MGDSMEPAALAAAARRHLLHCLREALGTAGRRPIAPLPALAEEAFVCAIMRHRVGALLHPALEQERIDGDLPADVPGLCRQAYFTILRRNLVTLEHGEALLALAGEAGIEAHARGPWGWLRGEARLYSDPGVRPADGLEVGVRRADEPELRDLARRLGFATVPEPEAGAPWLLWKTVGRLRLPLQIRAGAPEGASEALFDAVRGLQRVRFARWLGLVDIHQWVLQHGSPDEALRAEARGRRVERGLSAALRLARELLGTPVHDDAIADPVTRHRRGRSATAGAAAR